MPSHVLVLDDDHSILELYKQLLEEEGYQVTVSTFAYEDVAEIVELHPDLIILDIKLGRGQDGLLLLQKLRMYRPTKDIPVIICTAAVQAMQEQEEILREKDIPVVYKPFDIDELLRVIHQFLPSSAEA